MRPIRMIAMDIDADWRKAKNGIYFGAKPYLQAIMALNKITDRYYAADGESIVLYFLSNASTYRGENARRLKAELKALLPKGR